MVEPVEEAQPGSAAALHAAAGHRAAEHEGRQILGWRLAGYSQEAPIDRVCMFLYVLYMLGTFAPMLCEMPAVMSTATPGFRLPVLLQCPAISLPLQYCAALKK